MTPLEEFLTADTINRVKLWARPGCAAALRPYLGDEALAEYASLMAGASRPAARHLATSAPTNLIFLPGVMGSLLKSETLGSIWWLDLRNLKKLNELALQDDGHTDRKSDYAIAPATTDPSYEGFFVAALKRDDFGHRIHAYDWRKPLSFAVEGLRRAINETYDSNGRCKVHLVAHSMGGLVIRATLAKHHAELSSRLGRIVFIGTPHYGSPAIAGYLKNHLWGWDVLALLGRHLDRATFRSLWGVLALLPAPRLVYPGTRPSDPLPWKSSAPGDAYIHPCANFDLHVARSWELGLDELDQQRLQQALSAAADFHREMYRAHANLPQDLRDRMYQISGVGYKSLFRTAYKPRFGSQWIHMDKDTARVPGDPHNEGDGRVPVASADLEDLGARRYVKGVHGALATMPAVYNDVFRWLNGERLDLATTPAGALSAHLAAGQYAETPHLDGSYRVRDGEDPGFLDPAPVPEARLDTLEQQLMNGGLSDFRTARVL
jgi:pimeloyl-ACP methyl ester carboxylesterase